MAGRPTTMTTETLAKLKQSFLMGCSDREACLYAEIGLQTLYDYQKRNPEYSEQKRAFKAHPILKARKTIFDNLGEVKTAQWYLEKKQPKEFGLRAVVKAKSGSMRNNIPKPLTTEEALEIESIIQEQMKQISSSSNSV
ncbi:MAG: hypothetical protein PHO75_02935 [Candidatus Shapirobacteria bacterium]|nr:hypothetical protein [Candidatus Shapirobacteria bacterium]